MPSYISFTAFQSLRAAVTSRSIIRTYWRLRCLSVQLTFCLRITVYLWNVLQISLVVLFCSRWFAFIFQISQGALIGVIMVNFVQPCARIWDSLPQSAMRFRLRMASGFSDSLFYVCVWLLVCISKEPQVFGWRIERLGCFGPSFSGWLVFSREDAVFFDLK